MKFLIIYILCTEFYNGSLHEIDEILNNELFISISDEDIKRKIILSNFINPQPTISIIKNGEPIRIYCIFKIEDIISYEMSWFKNNTLFNRTHDIKTLREYIISFIDIFVFNNEFVGTYNCQLDFQYRGLLNKPFSLITMPIKLDIFESVCPLDFVIDKSNETIYLNMDDSSTKVLNAYHIDVINEITNGINKFSFEIIFPNGVYGTIRGNFYNKKIFILSSTKDLSIFDVEITSDFMLMKNSKKITFILLNDGYLVITKFLNILNGTTIRPIGWNLLHGVMYKPKKFVIVFVSNSNTFPTVKKITSKVNKNLMINCECSQKIAESSNIIWNMNLDKIRGKKLPNYKKFLQGTLLYIEKIQLTQAGYYHCNIIDPVSINDCITYQIEVIDAPNFVEISTNVVTRIHEPTEFLAVANSNPFSKSTWYHNGILVGKLKVLQSVLLYNIYSKVNINPVMEESNGAYQVIIENDLGQIIYNWILLVVPFEFKNFLVLTAINSSHSNIKFLPNSLIKSSFDDNIQLQCKNEQGISLVNISTSIDNINSILIPSNNFTGVHEIVTFMRAKRNGKWFEVTKTVLFNDWNLKTIVNLTIKQISDRQCLINWTKPYLDYKYSIVECLTSDYPIEKTIPSSQTTFQCLDVDPYSSCRFKISTYGLNDKILTSFIYVGDPGLISNVYVKDDYNDLISIFWDYKDEQNDNITFYKITWNYINNSTKNLLEIASTNKVIFLLNVERDKSINFSINSVNKYGYGPIKTIFINRLPNCNILLDGIPEYSRKCFYRGPPQVEKIEFTPIELNNNRYRLVGRIEKPSKWSLTGIKSYVISYNISNNETILENETIQLLDPKQSFYIELNQDQKLNLDINIKDINGFNGPTNNFSYMFNSSFDFLQKNEIKQDVNNVNLLILISIPFFILAIALIPILIYLLFFRRTNSNRKKFCNICFQNFVNILPNPFKTNPFKTNPFKTNPFKKIFYNLIKENPNERNNSNNKNNNNNIFKIDNSNLYLVKNFIETYRDKNYWLNSIKKLDILTNEFLKQKTVYSVVDRGSNGFICQVKYGPNSFAFGEAYFNLMYAYESAACAALKAIGVQINNSILDEYFPPIPGEETFISYKNSLYMWSKRHRNFSIIINSNVKNNLCQSTIIFNGKTYISDEFKSVIEAEQNVCFYILNDLCLLPSYFTFDYKECLIITNKGDANFISYEKSLEEVTNHAKNLKMSFQFNDIDLSKNNSHTIKVSLSIGFFFLQLESNNLDRGVLKEFLCKKALELLGLINYDEFESGHEIMVKELNKKHVESEFDESYEIKCKNGNDVSCNIHCALREKENDPDLYHKIQWSNTIENDGISNLLKDIESLEKNCLLKKYQSSLSHTEMLGKNLSPLNYSSLSLDSNTEFGVSQKIFLDKLKRLDETIINYERNIKL